MKIALAIIAALLLYGCGETRPLDQGGHGSNTVGSTVQLVAGWAAGLAGVAFIGAAIAVVWSLISGNISIAWKAGRIAVLALTGIAACGVLGWFGAHLWIVSLGCVLVGLAVLALVAWRHRKWIERKTGIDMNRDGKLG